MLIKFILIFCCFLLIIHLVCVNADNKRRFRRLPNTTTTSSPVSSESDLMGENMSPLMQMLHKINDGITSLSTVSDQHLRRLESFDYRLTKLEVQIQEKTDGLRTDLKEMTRRVQQLDWQSSKKEAALDTLLSDTMFLKQAVEHCRVTRQLESNVGVRSDVGLDISSKLQPLLGGVQSLLKGFSSLQTDIIDLKRNVSYIFNTTSHLENILPELLTMSQFQRSMLDMQYRTQHQICPLQSNVYSTSASSSEQLPADCSEVPLNKSGLYKIKPRMASAPFFVSCDMETNSGGWTVIQKRSEGALDFYRGWHDYKHGFGNIGGEFWLGLEKIHLLTNYKVNEIYIALEDFTSEKSYAHYSTFAVGNEIEGYPISFLGSYDGTAGDSLHYHAGQKFSTFDVDHDNWPEGNCAKSHTGAWWYNGCDMSNLNGKYLNGEIPEQYMYQGMYWYEWRGPNYSLKESKIMVRPVSEKYSKITGKNETSENKLWFDEVTLNSRIMSHPFLKDN